MSTDPAKIDEFRQRMEALYGSDYGWQRWFAKAFQIERRTLTKWIQRENAVRIPGWAWTAISLLEIIKHERGEIPMAELKVKGRPPSTGRYATRKELCEAVLRDKHIEQRSNSQIAEDAKVTYAVVQRIVAISEGMTPSLRKEIAAAAKERLKREKLAAKKKVA